MTEKQVVSKPQAAALTCEEVLADQKSLRQAVGRRLYRVLDGNAPSLSGSQQLLEARRVGRRRNHQDVPYPGQHQGGERVVDHGFVIDRKQLLRYCFGYRVTPRSAPHPLPPPYAPGHFRL